MLRLSQITFFIHISACFFWGFFKKTLTFKKFQSKMGKKNQNTRVSFTIQTSACAHNPSRSLHGDVHLPHSYRGIWESRPKLRRHSENLSRAAYAKGYVPRWQMDLAAANLRYDSPQWQLLLHFYASLLFKTGSWKTTYQRLKSDVKKSLMRLSYVLQLHFQSRHPEDHTNTGCTGAE